jgi:hypothetical protein
MPGKGTAFFLPGIVIKFFFFFFFYLYFVHWAFICHSSSNLAHPPSPWAAQNSSSKDYHFVVMRFVYPIMTSRAMLAGALAPARVTQARQVNG